VDSNSRPSFGESFDTLLEGNRRQLESLYDGSGIGGTESARNRKPAAGTPPVLAAQPVRLDKNDLDSLGPSAWLDRNYPDQWRLQVRDRRREGDEVVVLCCLELPGQDSRKAQFGSAQIDSPTPGVYRNERETEEAAYQDAVDDALRRCVQLL
jgi:hypothetical protein|tara:strand:- start:305 stop:763 length:459 start_codon:yes stop_codon:yes gene_type:complete